MSQSIPVLTVWQPWASLIAVGAKPYEFRKGLPPKGYIFGRIAVHAAKRPLVAAEVDDLLERLDGPLAWSTALKPDIAKPLLERFLRDPGIVPYSSILCTAKLGQPVVGASVVPEFGGIINDSDRDEHSRWAWPMLEIMGVVPAVEHKGQQGWSRWTPP